MYLAWLKSEDPESGLKEYVLAVTFRGKVTHHLVKQLGPDFVYSINSRRINEGCTTIEAVCEYDRQLPISDNDHCLPTDG